MEWPDKLEQCIDEAESLEEGVAEFVSAYVKEFPEARQLIYDSLEETEAESPAKAYDASDKFANPEYFGIKSVEENANAAG